MRWIGGGGPNRLLLQLEAEWELKAIFPRLAPAEKRSQLGLRGFLNRKKAHPSSESSSATERKRVKEADECRFESFPTPMKFRSWKMHVREEVVRVSGCPHKACPWSCKVDEVENLGELVMPGKFATLDVKLAAGLARILNGEFERQVTVLKEKAAAEYKLIGGRQVAFLMNQHFRMSTVDGALLEFDDLMALQLKGDNLRGFMNDWEMTLLGLKKRPGDEYLECLFKRQIEKSRQLEQAMALYNQGIAHEGKPRSYDRMVSIVTSHLEEKKRRKNREMMEAGLQGGNRLAPAKQDTKPQKGICYQWSKGGSCTKGEDCPYSHPQAQRGRSPERKAGGKRGGTGQRRGSRSSSARGDSKPPSPSSSVSSARGRSPSE